MKQHLLSLIVAILANCTAIQAHAVLSLPESIRAVGANLSLSGLWLGEPPSTSTASNVVQAKSYPGADCGAKVNAADASLGTGAGEIDVDKNCGTVWTTPITLSGSHNLRILEPGVYAIPSGNVLSGSNAILGLGDSTMLQLSPGPWKSAAFTVKGNSAVFQSLKLDGNSANESSRQTGISVDQGVSSLRLSRVTVTNWKGIALDAHGTAANPVLSLSIDNSRFDTSGQAMIFLNDVDVASITGNHFAHCGVPTGGCVAWEMTATRKQISFVNNTCAGSGPGHCFTQGPFHPSLTYSNCIITGNLLDSAAGSAGISPQCSSATISKNTFINGPSTGGNWLDGLEFYGSNAQISRNVITNGLILIGTPADVPSNDISVIGNIVSNAGSSGDGCIQIGDGPGLYPAMNAIRIQGNHCDLTGLTRTAIGIGNPSGPAQTYTNLVIDRNTIEGNRFVRAIQLSPAAAGSAGWEITNNKIHNASIGLRLANGGNVGDIIFAGNDLAGTTTPSTVTGSPGALYRCGNSLSPAKFESGSSCLTGVTGNIGGTFLAARQCAAGTAAVRGASVGMAATSHESAGAFAGSSFRVRASVVAPNTVSVKVCALNAGTPTAGTYTVQVIPQ